MDNKSFFLNHILFLHFGACQGAVLDSGFLFFKCFIKNELIDLKNQPLKLDIKWKKYTA